MGPCLAPATTLAANEPLSLAGLKVDDLPEVAQFCALQAGSPSCWENQLGICGVGKGEKQWPPTATATNQPTATKVAMLNEVNATSSCCW